MESHLPHSCREGKDEILVLKGLQHPLYKNFNKMAQTQELTQWTTKAMKWIFLEIIYILGTNSIPI